MRYLRRVRARGPAAARDASRRARDDRPSGPSRPGRRRLLRPPARQLGHRRLAIIDVAGGAQPLANEDDTCWIVFNGEVYNHRTLRPELEAAGHRFRTSSDTETIVHAWEEYGPACVERLEGMFAFAILDERRRELFIARDRLGKKPLYYAVLDGVLHFASELPALAASPSWKGDLDLSGLEGYLSLGYLLAPNTPFAGVFKLPPAHTLHVKDGRVDDETLLGRHRVRLRPARRERLARRGGRDARRGRHGSARKRGAARRVPVRRHRLGPGRVLHGRGARAIGSSRRRSDLPRPRTTNWPPPRLTAAHVKARHHEHLIEPSLDEVLDPATIGCGEPMADSSAIPTWYVSRAARSHVTVALSGDGGDETFAGYDFRYVPHVLESRARRLVPGAAGRRLARWTGRAWPRGARVPRALRAGTLLDNLSRDAASAFYVDLCFLKPAPTRALMGLDPADERDSAAYAAVTDVYRRCPSSEPLTRAQYTDLHVYMPNDPLVKVDRMSMAHGLEVRSPLLDRRVVELAFEMPPGLRQRGRTGKWILRELAKRRLPAALAAMPKRGLHCAGRSLDRRPLCRPLRGRGAGAVDAHRSAHRSLDLARLVRRASCGPRRPQLRAVGHVGARALAAERGATDATPADAVATR